MQIERQKFKEILETVKYGLAGKEELLIGSTSFLFKENKVFTFNDSVGVSCIVPDLDFEGEVNSTELLGFVNKSGAKLLTISVEDDILYISSGKAKAEITLKTESTLPIEAIGNVNKWKKFDSEILDGIKYVHHACGNNLTQPLLTCIHLKDKKVEASDGYRIASFGLKDEIPVNEFLLPSLTVSYISAIKPTHISLGEAWVHFKNEEIVMGCRIFESDDKYPNTEHLLQFTGQDIVFPDNILDILSRASVFKRSDVVMSAFASISFSDKKIEIGSISDTGKFNEKAKVAYEGDSISFDVTIELLQEVLKETTTAKYNTKTNMLSFLYDNKKYVTMLRGKV